LEKLTQFDCAIVQDAPRSWSIYVSANAAEMPTVVYGLGLDPNRMSLFDRQAQTAPNLQRAVND
jgi:hypothetical protein